jgi:hypothetical protein
MTPEEILTGNKLIAEFMGRKFSAYRDNHFYCTEYDTYDSCMESINKRGLVGYYPEIGWQQKCGLYNSSWDWLMPVVEKIEHAYFEVTIKRGFCEIRSFTHRDNFTKIQTGCFDSDTKIGATYMAIIEFLNKTQIQI